MARKLSVEDLQILKKLAPELMEELNYLVALIFEGMESLHCIKKEHVDALVEVVGMRTSKIKAAELLELYKFAGD